MISFEEQILRIILVVIITGVIGFEREYKHKAAGLSTHVLVAIGACGIALLQQSLIYEAIEISSNYENLSVNIENQRLIAQVVTGIGFLGAGTILKTNSNISGLTTAASIWVCGMIGVIIGSGEYLLGIVIGVQALMVLYVFKSVKYHRARKRAAKLNRQKQGKK